MNKKILVGILSVILFVTMSQTVFAFSFWPLVPCGLNAQPKDSNGVELPKVPTQENPDAHDYTQPCGQCDLLKLFKNIIDFILIGLMPPVAAILFVWGGFLILMGGANPGWITQGKSIFWNTAIGVVILLASWLITNTIIRSLAADDVAPEWWKFECRVTTPAQTPPVTGGGIQYDCSSASTCVVLPAGQEGTYPDLSTCQRDCEGITPPITLPPGEKLYTCNQNDQCVEDPNGEYDNSNCDQVCSGQPPTTTQPPATTNLSITTPSLSDARQNSDYSQTVQATGGNTPYNWSISGSAQLPQGLTINSSTGEISGKPTTSGNFTFTVMVEDSSSPQKSGTKQLSIKVVAPASSVVISNVAVKNITSAGATITWTTDKPAGSQVAYGTTTAYSSPGSPTPLNSSQVTSHSINITGLNGNTTYNYQAVSSITGFTARSSNNTFLTLLSSTQFSIPDFFLPNGVQGTPYYQTIPIEGGLTPYRWSVIGTLPAGLTSNPVSGEISGTPTTPGTTTVTIKAEDSSTPKKSATKPLSIKIAPGVSRGTCTGATCSDSNINVCVANSSANCEESAVNNWNSQIGAAAAANQIGSGIDTVKLVKAIMSQESGGRTNLTSFDGTSFGLMQMRPTTAQSFKTGCTSQNITSQWLLDSNNAQANICIAINYIKSLIGPCGSEIRNIAAGYNGGGAAKGACQNSTSCSSCSVCGTQTTRRWECPWDGPDAEHVSCNVDRRDTGTGNLDNFGQTRIYAPKVAYCYGRFSSSTGGGSLAISTSSLPNATEKIVYSQNLAATGGTGTLSWSVSNGSLPSGLSLNFSSGKITGTPATAGTSTFTVRVIDNSNPQKSATKQLSIVVAGGSATGDICPSAQTLATQHNEIYPSGRSPALNTLLSCISGKLGQPIPSEGGVNAFYGSTYTIDGSSPQCNYTRGDKHCDSSCSHAINSCHYGGRTGNQGSLAVDFGNELKGDIIIQAAVACGVPSSKARCENAAGSSVGCVAGSGANHIHISAPTCDAN